MKLGICLGGFGLIAVGVATTVQRMERSVADHFQYASPDVGEMTLLDVCSVTPSSLTCWRPDRTPDPEFAAKQDATLRTQRVDLPMFYHRSSYFLFFHAGGRANMYPFSNEVIIEDHQTGGSPYRFLGRELPNAFHDIQTTGYDAPGIIRSMLSIPPDQESIDMTIKLPVALPVIKHRLDRTQTYALGDWTLTIEKVVKVSGTDLGESMGHTYWAIPYRLVPAGTHFGDASGSRENTPYLGAVRYLDRDGKTPNLPPTYFPPFGVAVSKRAIPTSTWWLTLDPKMVDHLELQPYAPRPVLFPDIPLRPGTEG